MTTVTPVLCVTGGSDEESLFALKVHGEADLCSPARATSARALNTGKL